MRSSAVRAGVVAGLLWLIGGAGYALVTWFGGLPGDVVRLLLPETIPVAVWHTPGAEILVPALSTAAFGLLVAGGVMLLGRRGRPRGLAGVLAVWAVVVLAAAIMGLVFGIAAASASWPPPRTAFLVQGVPGEIARTAYAGVIGGWLPALVAILPRTVAPRARSRRRIAAAATAAAALVALGLTPVVWSGAIRDARDARAAEPAPSPVPTGDPPAEVAPGSWTVDPAWCVPERLAFTATEGDAATGHRTAAVTVTNTGPSPCVLPGYPDLAFAESPTGIAVDAPVAYGGSFMTEDPGPVERTLDPGATLTAQLGWDGPGNGTVGFLWVAPYPGAERTVVPTPRPFDITEDATVFVTAWQPIPDPAGDEPSPPGG